MDVDAGEDVTDDGEPADAAQDDELANADAVAAAAAAVV